jgi:4-amino-4-deoxy-L-arabinose transferase-like glycosyltransferase
MWVCTFTVLKLLQHKKLPFAILLLLFAAVLLLKNGSTALWEQDEAAYAGFAWQMNHSGNYLIPDFPWSEPHRKTPLHFWLIAGCYKLFGASEGATRIPSVLAILGTVIIMWRMGKKLLPDNGSTLAALALMGNLLLIALAKISFTDAALLFFETLALLSLLSWIQRGGYKYAILWTIAIAGGLLTKGPPILIVALGCCGILFLFSNKRLLAFIAGLLALLACTPLLIGGIVANQANPGFITWLIDWYILKRTSGAVFGQTGPPGYHLAVIILSFIAVLPWLPSAVIQLAKSTFKRDNTAIALTGWLIFGWLFYELLPSKLPTYAIAAYPAIALIIGQYASVQSTKIFKALGWLRIIILSLASVSITGITLYMGDYLSAVIASPLILLSLYIAYTDAKSQEILPRFTSGFLLCMLLAAGAWLFVIPQIEGARSASKKAAEYMNTNAGKTRTVSMSKHFQMPGWPVYCAWNNLTFTTAFDENQWVQQYNNKTADYLVFDEENISRFKELMGNQLLNDTTINGIISDRGKTVTYHLVKIPN